MRWKEITEAPITDFGAYGDLEKEGSFRPDDLRAIRNPKWLNNVYSAFAKTPYEFNLYVYNAEDGRCAFHQPDGSWSYLNVRDLKDVRKWSGVYSIQQMREMLGVTPPNYEQRLNVLLVENEGSGRVPLTPWIIAHRIGHAMLYAGGDYAANGTKDLNYAVRNFYSLMNNMMNRLKSTFASSQHHAGRMAGAKERDRLDDPTYGDTNQLGVIASLIGKMKSAKNENLTTGGEFFVECMAQYIVQGKVTFERPMLDDRGLGKPWAELSPKDQQLLDLARSRVWDKDFDGNDFAEAIVDSVESRPPTDSWIAYDDRGRPMAQMSASFDPNGPRGDELRARGLTIKHSPVTPAMLRGYQQRLKNREKEVARVAALWDQWAAEGRLNRNADWRTSTDELHLALAGYEKQINEALHAIFVRCYGKLLVL